VNTTVTYHTIDVVTGLLMENSSSIQTSPELDGTVCNNMVTNVLSH
jgi:hypothetical protein